MLKEFREFIRNEKLGDETSRYLLTVSGGVDSVVMCALFYRCGFSFGIAHCNFGLRGAESDGDEAFVKKLADSYGVPFFRKSFSTGSYARRKKISIQMAARELRYDWLKRLALEKQYDRIATAHHLDDSIETFFINLLRGSGIAGLHGIASRNELIIRPLLFSNKRMIRSFAEKNRLAWREDSSNRTDKYLRNSIRHHLVPSLKKLNVGFEETIAKEFSYLKDAADIFRQFIAEKKKEIVTTDGRNVLLNIRKLQESGYAETILHELLRTYDFTPETTELIAKRLFTTAGKKFFSPTYRLIRDRDFLILSPVTKILKGNRMEQEEEIQIPEEGGLFEGVGYSLLAVTMEGDLSSVNEKNKHTAYLDHAQLAFPLKVRKWQEGDFFRPLGMKGKKKISDFLIDQKVPIHEKEEIRVMLSGNDIVWVLHHRIDNRYKITASTQKILKVICR